jgi:3-methyladenine DNA glycosylase AlkD
MVEEIRARLQELADERAAEISRRFFKTGPGQYGEGDVFLGIRVPVLRKVAKAYAHIGTETAAELLRSPIHEERLLALLILVNAFAATPENRHGIYQLYLDHTRWVNNWDLVDSSAPYIAGAWLADKDRSPLYRLAGSESLWERRIAIVATFHFIRRGEFADTLNVAERLLTDKHDLIHKAVGWMLREVGKRDLGSLESFLRAHHRAMPRTMLRYAIERLPENERRVYLRWNP